MADPFKSPKPFNEQTLNKSKGILDDHAIRKSVVTREGSITKTPVADIDIANKKYVDDSFPVTHASTTGQTTDDHHAETHTIVSHDIIATGAEVDAAISASTTHIADNSQAHSDYMLNTGDTATGNYTIGQILSLNSANALIRPSVDNGYMLIQGSITGNEGAKIQFFGADHGTFPGNIYLDYGDYTKAAPAGSKIYLRYMNNSVITNAIVCDNSGNSVFGGNINASGSVTAGGWLASSAGTPGLQFYENDVGANLKYMDIIASGGSIEFRCVNDAYTAAETYLQIGRNALSHTIATVTIPNGYFKINDMKSGATQAAAGAAANELWKTNGHAHLEDNVVMIGV